MYTIYDYSFSINKNSSVEEKVVLNYYFSTMYTVTLKPNKEKQLIKHHPWVFSGAIDKIEPKFTSVILTPPCLNKPRKYKFCYL